ncbi:histidine tRNA synthetase (Histidine--tRNA ligase) (HisRS) [Candidatus Glomeribacter gigasporarum BEG34]|uniref:Histidine--tRNA ligase n=1 Tax=Candidatus Glomeribacter gigasporarum BEG34 TaxID=1070319 RepID=G2JA91_9BURK|nr:histidine--tRNA ligase [Candidatus Glomeribacter gigasporarum]CCD29692.1 histidine tRNA synthetase (Histidine--tRNA ligase) (HisRS) [Candidatus Glomeribacter gigasporarum BEG34]
MLHPDQKPLRLASVKGMNDILPEQAALWAHFEDAAQTTLRAYGYQRIRTPIVEHTSLFARSIGAATDIVEKEMYCFTDALNGEQLSLRPENTAAIVRAAIEHHLLYDGPKRLWYSGPMFRHERPQRGRYRQFHQLGVEALGFAGPDVDAEIILAGQRLWDCLQLQGLRLELNTLGQLDERAAHRAALADYLKRHIELLDEDAKRRLETNPLRILDTKNPALQDIMRGAPRLMDFLGEASRAHFEALRRILQANGISFTLNPRLVRGLDYYNLTVFEWVTDRLGAQGSVAGGGRYDRLIEQLGGKPAPACGWALGVERILELLKENDPGARPEPHCDAYVLHQGEAARTQAFAVSERLRAAGLSVVQHCSGDGAPVRFKTQMKHADASGAQYAVIIGEDEVNSGTVTIKALRRAADALEGNAAQRRIAVECLSRDLFEKGG